MRKKKTGVETPEYSHPMPPVRPLPELDELSHESDSAPIYRKAIAGIPTKKRLIDANAIQYHETTECHGHGLFFTEKIAYKEEVEQIPAIDAVEVARCKDCACCDTETAGPFEFLLCRNTGREVTPMDFCSRGIWRDPR